MLVDLQTLTGFTNGGVWLLTDSQNLWLNSNWHVKIGFFFVTVIALVNICAKWHIVAPHLYISLTAMLLLFHFRIHRMSVLHVFQLYVLFYEPCERKT